MLNDSILTTIKKLLGIPEDYDAFDMDITIHINSAFSTLHQLGVGPDTAFSIDDKQATWSQFLGDKTDINSVKTYVQLSTRIIFDPPQNSATLEAFKERLRELEFRLLVASEKVNDGERTA